MKSPNYTIKDIEEAIGHIDEVLSNSCINEKCKQDHLLLKVMLQDLLMFKEKYLEENIDKLFDKCLK